MRVLVVEDEKKTASFVRKALQAENFAVDMMANGEDALILRATLAPVPDEAAEGATPRLASG